MAWTNTGGGDHEGANWTPADTLVIAGTHYNIGTFTVTTGYTVYANPLQIYADEIDIVGTLNGDGRGSYGGASRSGSDYNGAAGSGCGGGAGGEGCGYQDYCTDPTAGGGGGGGYGGAGHAGLGGGCGAGGAGGGTCSNSTAYVLYSGSGGGSGGTGDVSTCVSGAGGTGGGSILLLSDVLTITGTITVDGNNGSNASGSTFGSGGGGAGAGGSIFIVGNVITATGTFNADGGNGGSGVHCAGTVPDGGSGGAGRIKVFYCNSLDTSGITTSVVGGTDYGTGGAGSYTTQKFNSCTSSIPIGQEFTLGSASIAVISQIKLYVDAVNTSGDFILKVWDSTSKNTEYATKTLTITDTGEIAFDFDGWFRLPNGTQTYYVELTTAGSGDIDIAIEGNSTFAGGDMHRDGVEIIHTDIYHKVYTICNGHPHVIDAVVYNTADTGVKCNVTNDMLLGSIHRINEDNTGTVQYTDNFTTAKYIGDYTALLNVTHDTTNDELDIADDGYIYYTIDTKYPITGIPTLTSTINITAGTPTIQISSNGSTWYNIDTAIVDDTSTIYTLDNAVNLQLDGLTVFYFRFDCVKAGAATCSIKLFQLDVNIVTIDAQNPVIIPNVTNTYRCDQSVDSGINCEIDLIYYERRWA